MKLFPFLCEGCSHVLFSYLKMISCRSGVVLSGVGVLKPALAHLSSLLKESGNRDLLPVQGGTLVFRWMGVPIAFKHLLTLGGVPEKLPFALNHLNCLEYHVCFGARDEVSLALCLIKSSPNLKEFFIEVFASTNAAEEGPVLELFEVKDKSDCSLNQLREAHIISVSGSRPDLEFIKLILANSPMLEKMHIQPNSQATDRGLRMLKELTRFGCASPKVEIIFKDSAEV